MPKYLIELRPGECYIGEQIPTHGNDEEFPSFILEDGRTVGCHISCIIKQIEEEVNDHKNENERLRKRVNELQITCAQLLEEVRLQKEDIKRVKEQNTYFKENNADSTQCPHCRAGKEV